MSLVVKNQTHGDEKHSANNNDECNPGGRMKPGCIHPVLPTAAMRAFHRIFQDQLATSDAPSFVLRVHSANGDNETEV
jgi:hypothetical protein